MAVKRLVEATVCKLRFVDRNLRTDTAPHLAVSSDDDCPQLT